MKRASAMELVGVVFEIVLAFVMLWVSKESIESLYSQDPGAMIAYSILIVIIGFFLGSVVKLCIDNKRFSELEEAIEELNRSHDKELQRLKEDHAKEVADLRVSHAGEMAQLKNDRDSQLKQAQEAFDKKNANAEAKLIARFRREPMYVKWLCAMALNQGYVLLDEEMSALVDEDENASWDYWLDEETMPNDATRYVLTEATKKLLGLHPDLIEAARAMTTDELLRVDHIDSEDIEAMRETVRAAGVKGRETLSILMETYPDWFRTTDYDLISSGLTAPHGLQEWLEIRVVRDGVSDCRLSSLANKILKSIPEELDDVIDDSLRSISLLTTCAPGVKEIGYGQEEW